MLLVILEVLGLCTIGSIFILGGTKLPLHIMEIFWGACLHALLPTYHRHKNEVIIVYEVIMESALKLRFYCFYGENSTFLKSSLAKSFKGE
jgi:hypothetical protein